MYVFYKLCLKVECCLFWMRGRRTTFVVVVTRWYLVMDPVIFIYLQTFSSICRKYTYYRSQMDVYMYSWALTTNLPFTCRWIETQCRELQVTSWCKMASPFAAHLLRRYKEADGEGLFLRADGKLNNSVIRPVTRRAAVLLAMFPAAGAFLFPERLRI